ncbi:MAG: DUF368 domain-containing protein [Clostridiales bacterium]|nr:DUF368 domain-containing protein [Clostridiales bacterium]
MKSAAVKDFFYKILCGFLLGTAVIAPGISCSVIAIIMGIYSDLIEIVSNPFKNLKRNILYLIPLGIGALGSVVVLLRALEWLFDRYSTPAYFLFIGLIAGSLPAIFKEAKTGPFKKRYILAIVTAFAIAIAIGIPDKLNITFAADTTSWLYFSICGALAGIASLVPGMSVSVILMVLGVYEPMLEATANFDVVTMMPVGIAFVLGMVLFSRFAKYVFKRFHSFAYYMVSGFMLGSIATIFPQLPTDAPTIILSVLAVGFGLFISIFFQVLGKNLRGATEKESTAILQ